MFKKGRKILNKQIWLSKSWIFGDTEWNSSISTLVPRSARQRSYDIWSRANSLIERNESSFDLIDGIANLKRSLNHRLKLIEKIYNFKKIDFSIRPKGYLELLEIYGIVRPYLLRTTMEIRNFIEHNDSEPPNQQRCKELVDMIWYFLKSTDFIVTYVTNDFSFDLLDKHNNQTHYGGTIEIDWEKHELVRINGWFPIEAISQEKKKDNICIDIEELHGKEKWNGSLYHQDKLETDLWIIGAIDTKYFDYHELIRYLLTFTI